MFRGAFTALVTPFRNGQLDVEAFKSLVQWQIEGKIHGLVPCGTTGESPTLSHEEHVQVVRHTVEIAAGRVPVIAGAGSNNTVEAVALSKGAKEAGATATLQITPYYNRPCQEGLYRHFSTIADSVDIPLVLYNVPGRTSVDLLPPTVARLAKHPNIVGIKEATADMTRVSSIKASCAPDFCVLSGDDFTIYPLLALGGDGVISVTSNAMPTVVADLCRRVDENKHEEAKALHEQQLALCETLFCRPNPTMIKAMLHKMGICGPEIRLPLLELPPSSEDEARLLTTMKAAGLATG